MPKIEQAGTYDASVVDSYVNEARTGTLQVVVQFETTDGQHIWHYLSCTPKSWKYTLEALKTMGWNPADPANDLIELHGEDGYPSAIRGAQVEIVVDWDVYNGNERLKVKWINPVGGVSSIERLSRDDVRMKSVKLRAMLAGASHASTGGKASSRPASPALVGVTNDAVDPNDDIPF